MNPKKFVSILLIFAVLLVGAVLIFQHGSLTAETPGRSNALVNALAPAGFPAGQADSQPAGTHVVAEPVSSLPLRDLPVGEYFPQNDWYQLWLDGELDMDFDGVPPALRPFLLEEAMNLPASTFNPSVGPGPILTDSWDSIDSNQCCGGGSLTPPDPEMAAGPNHVIAVVNAAFEIYDTDGVSLVGPTTFTTFFAPLGGGCLAFPFDPNVLYDESADRYLIAADGNGVNYCVGVSQTNDPTGSYWLYAFPANIGGAFFDYPHAGVGHDAIYLGANLFGSGQGYVYALDKAAMYAGGAAGMVSRILSGGFHTTPQPYNAHGWAQGTWPSTGPHYIFAGTGFGNAASYHLYSWDDPFGANVLTLENTFNLPAIHGVAVGNPVNALQQGGSSITGNDPRPLDFEYRDGTAWTAMTVSCNPGGGTVNCIQWAQIDLANAAVLQTDVFGSTGEYRYFPDFGVDACGNAVVGYTRSSATTWPSVYAAGPVNAGSNPAETLIKAGETAHYTYANRWGDYSGMTVGPDGTTLWYLGEYSPNNGNPNVNWGNYIGEMTLNCNPNAPQISLEKTVGTTPGVCAGTDAITVPPGTDVYYCYEVTNTGSVTLTLHDLDDSEFGNIFAGLTYTLTPGASVDTVAAGLTISATVNMTTTNTATWTAYNPGPSDVVTATDTAAVYMDFSPGISLDKTVGTTPGVCATTDAIMVTPGTDVYYCYEVTNTGAVTLTLHDLDDSELGNLISSLPYTLTPGASVDTVAAGLTISATINMTTTNTATWTAYNPGPSDVVTATDTATVTLDFSPHIAVNPAALTAEIEPDVQYTVSLTISNLGYNPLNWTVYEETGAGGGSCADEDIPWLSTDPSSGTTTMGSSDTVDVAFDSTGLAVGVYTGTLCVDSNDPANPQVRVPVTLTVAEAEHLMYLPIMLYNQNLQPEAASSEAAGSPAPMALGVMALPAAMAGVWLVSRPRPVKRD